MTNEIWGQIRDALRETVGEANFRNWIEPLEFSKFENGVALFLVPTNFMGDWVKRNFGDKILRQMLVMGHPIERVDFKVPAVARPTVARPAKPAPEPEAEVPGAPLDPRFVFDRFVVGKPNELAHAAARRVAEGADVTFNPLFLYGGVGLGKTHLMHAIAHELQARQPHLKVVYLSAEQFMYRFVQALREKQMMDFKQIFRSVDILMVDDVQFIAGKDSTQEEFFHTFNALVDQNKQIIISADRAPGEIKDLEDRIKSRLQCGLVVDLHPTDYELRLGILQTKVEFHRAQYGDLPIADGVLEFLAHRITSNIRVLEGALMRLFAFASLVGKEITLDLTQDCLADILRASDRKVTIEEIQRKVSRTLQHPPFRHDRPAPDARHRAPAPGRDVSVQTHDIAIPARDRAPVWRPRSHHGHARRQAHRGPEETGRPDRRGHRTAAPRAGSVTREALTARENTRTNVKTS